VVDNLGRAGVPVDVVDTAELLVSELVTNAVLHAQGPTSSYECATPPR